MSVIVSVVPFIITGAVAGIAGVAALTKEVISATGEAASVAGEIAEEKYAAWKQRKAEEKSITLSTIIRNEQLLQKSLQNLGAKNIITNPQSIEGKVDEFHIVFEKTPTGLFNIKFVGEIEQEEAEQFRTELQDEYGKVVQDYVYTQLKQKAEDKGLVLEKETVQKDQSIVLTYNINSNG